jgi:hypothetical protein
VAEVEAGQDLTRPQARDLYRAHGCGGRGGVEDDDGVGAGDEPDGGLGGSLRGAGREDRGRQREAADRTLE